MFMFKVRHRGQQFGKSFLPMTEQATLSTLVTPYPKAGTSWITGLACIYFYDFVEIKWKMGSSISLILSFFFIFDSSSNY